MNVQDLTFGLKDVIWIVTGIVAGIGIIYAQKAVLDKIRIRMDVLEANNSINAQDILDCRNEFKEKETEIYSKMEDIRTEQKASHDKMSAKLDTLSAQLATVNMNLAELTGYMRGKKEGN